MLADRWCELTPWPEAADILAELAARKRIGVITNCSEELGVEASRRTGVSFDVFLTSERAGYYKPNPRIYAMAIREIGASAERILYVADSPYDVCGAAASGMPVFWHNRAGLPDAKASSSAISAANTLLGVRSLIGC